MEIPQQEDEQHFELNRPQFKPIDMEEMKLSETKVKQVIGQVLMLNGCEDLSRIDPIYA